MQFLKRCVGEKIGPGAMLMPWASAIWNNFNESVCSGNSSHRKYPPAGWLTRVCAGK